MLSAAVAGGRAAIGLAVLVAPRAALRTGGYAGAAESAAGVSVARLFGVRELVLGAMVLERLRFGVPEITLLRMNAICDGLDAAVITTGPRGSMKLVSLFTALSATSAWIAMAQSTPE